MKPLPGCLILAFFPAVAIPLHAQAPAAVTPPAPAVQIQVHAAQPTGPYRPLWNFFGADEPNYIYAPNGQKLLGELAALSPVPVYFRPHNLFTTGNGDGSLKWGSTNVYTETPEGSHISRIPSAPRDPPRRTFVAGGGRARRPIHLVRR